MSSTRHRAGTAALPPVVSSAGNFIWKGGGLEGEGREQRVKHKHHHYLQ